MFYTGQRDNTYYTAEAQYHINNYTTKNYFEVKVHIN